MSCQQEPEELLEKIKRLISERKYRIRLHAVVAVANKERTISMTALMKSPCSECGGRVRRKAISQEFEREGVRVKLSGFKAWVCEQCGEVYFEPGGAEKVAQAVNSLFALAFAQRQRKSEIRARVS